MHSSSLVKFTLLNLESRKNRILVTWLSIITKYTYPLATVKNLFSLTYAPYALSRCSQSEKMPFFFNHYQNH